MTYRVTTEIHEDLSADRYVLAESDSAYIAGDREKSPFIFDVTKGWKEDAADQVFGTAMMKPRIVEYNSTDIVAYNTFPSIEAVRYEVSDARHKDNPMLKPEESAVKRFRWFYTYFDYSCIYRKISGLPVSLSDYMTDEEQRVFLKTGLSPDGSNGIEQYYLLDEYNEKFMNWYTHCVFKANYDLIYDLCDTGHKDMLSETEGSLFKLIDRNTEDPSGTDPAEFCSEADNLMDTDYFSSLYTMHRNKIDAGYEKYKMTEEYFNYSFLNNIILPGKIIKTNASAIKDGMPQWVADGYRLLYEDMYMTATSRKANAWAFVLSFILIAAGITAVLTRYRK